MFTAASRGVQAPANQGRPANEGTALTVTNVSPAEWVVVEYFDQDGRREQNIFLKVGGNLYAPRDNSSAVWCRNLAPVQDWLSKAVLGRLPKPGAQPTKMLTAVDVLPPTPAPTESA
jgi:hypothetical protein